MWISPAADVLNSRRTRNFPALCGDNKGLPCACSRDCPRPARDTLLPRLELKIGLALRRADRFAFRTHDHQILADRPRVFFLTFEQADLIAKLREKPFKSAVRQSERLKRGRRFRAFLPNLSEIHTVPQAATRTAQANRIFFWVLCGSPPTLSNAG